MDPPNHSSFYFSCQGSNPPNVAIKVKSNQAFYHQLKSNEKNLSLPRSLDTMHPSLTSTYLFPAVCLNPILFLHCLNTILSRILPPIVAAEPVQPPPYTPLGPSPNHPHLDVHQSDNLCWSYTLVIVLAQLYTYTGISSHRTKRKERKEKASRANGNMNGHAKSANTDREDSYFGESTTCDTARESGSSSPTETEDETIL